MPSDRYRKAFALHDQGHSPFRKGVEIGQRSFLGLNFDLLHLQAVELYARAAPRLRPQWHSRPGRGRWAA